MNRERCFLLCIAYAVLILIFPGCNGSEKGGAASSLQDNSKKLLISKASTVTQSFPFSYDNGTISFGITVNDSIFGDFIFDSGLTTSFNLFSNRFARLHDLSILPSKPEKFYGVDNRQTVPVINQSFYTEIFKRKRKVQFGITSFSRGDEDRYAGVLNIHIFKDSIVEFDFANRQIKFHKSFTGEGYSRLNIVQRGSVRMVEVEVCLSKGKRIKGLFLLDTGYGGFLYLHADSNQFPELKANLKTKRLLGSTNFAKLIDTHSIEVESAGIGGLKVESPTMDFIKSNLPAEAKGIVLGMVGNNFLDRYNVVIDFKNNVMFLKQLHRTVDPRRFFLGITFFTSKTNKIIKIIVENSAAHKMGLVAGDVVTAVNGIGINGYSETELDSFLDGFEKNTTPVRMDCVRNGKPFSIALR